MALMETISNMQDAIGKNVHTTGNLDTKVACGVGQGGEAYAGNNLHTRTGTRMKWNMAWHAGSLETNQGLGTNYSEKNSSPLNINLAKLLGVWLP